MSKRVGNFTIGTTGDISIAGLTFLPTSIQFFLAGTVGTDSTCRHCSGGATLSNQFARSSFTDGTHFKSSSSSSKCIQHWKWNGSAIVADVEATLKSFDTNGGGDFGFTVNATASNANISIGFIASDG